MLLRHRVTKQSLRFRRPLMLRLNPVYRRSTVEQVLERIRVEKIQKGLVHNPNKKTDWINVPNIVAAARDDSFAKYLEMHELERPDPPHCNDWKDHHDCAFLRSHGYLARKGYNTLRTYIGIAQLADYLDNVPDRDPRIRWQEFLVTDSKLLFARLCHDVGIRPRAFGPFVHGICKATAGQRSNLALFGGRKLVAPPPWTVNKEAFDAVLDEERTKAYRSQARRRGSQVDANAAELPAYGKRAAAKKRAPRRKRAKQQEEHSEEFYASKSESSDHAFSGMFVYPGSRCL